MTSTTEPSNVDPHELMLAMQRPLGEVYLLPRHAVDGDHLVVQGYPVDVLKYEEGRGSAARSPEKRLEMYYRAFVLASFHLQPEGKVTCYECFINALMEQQPALKVTDCPAIPSELALEHNSHRHLSPL